MEKGEIAGEKYCIVSKLGNGGRGEVYIVEDLAVGKLWVMKVCGREKMEYIRLLQKMNHKKLPVFIDCFIMNDKTCIVMEYIEGETLQMRLKREGSIPKEESLKLAMEILEVLKYLHEFVPAVIYGDLKPSNIMLDYDGNIKLIDIDDAFMPHDRAAYGTLGYAAPEQILPERTARDIDHRVDIYSFGILFYEMLTGGHPLDKNGVIEIKHPILGETLKDIIYKCLHIEKELRYDNIDALIEDIKMCHQEEHMKRLQYIISNFIFFTCFFICITLFHLGINKNEKFLISSLLFWGISFLWYRIALKKQRTFFKGEGIRVFATEKKAAGLFLLFIIMLLGYKNFLEVSGKTIAYKNIITIKSIEESRDSVQSICIKNIEQKMNPIESKELTHINGDQIKRDSYGRKLLENKNLNSLN